VTDATDPRWVLATRTAELLQGEVLPPERRERLMKLGRLLRISRFDTCLIIAMVQDQARRGIQPGHIPAAAEPQLRMIALPGEARRCAPALRRRWWITACWVAAIMVVEAVVLLRLF